MDERQQIKQDEGFVKSFYTDSVGVVTIGWGHAVQPNDPKRDDPRWRQQAFLNMLFEQDYRTALRRAEEIVNEKVGSGSWDMLPEEAQSVLVNMAFNIGYRLRHFANFFAAMEILDYDEMALEMLDSKWAEQVGARAVRLARRMRRCES